MKASFTFTSEGLEEHLRLEAIHEAVQAAYHDNGGLDGVNALLGTVRVEDLSIIEMLAYLRNAASGQEQMPNHARFREAAMEELRRRGEPEDRIAHLFKGLIP